MKLTKELWGTSPCGKEILLYTLENESGAYVQLTNIGAGIVSVVVPDKDGHLADVALEMGTNQNYNFSRWFRVVTDMTPFQYRRSQLSGK